MKVCSENFKQEIKNLGRQQDIIISYTENNEEKTLTNENVNSVSVFYKGNLLKSMMKSLEIESLIPIEVGTELNVRYGVLVGDSYEYINLGKFYIYKVESQEDTSTYIIKCYDLMIFSMVNYDDIEINIDWQQPKTVEQYLRAVINAIGLQWNTQTSGFANSTKLITADLYKGIGYTVRDVLDDISEVAGGSLCINNNNLIEMRYPTTASQYTINEEYLKDVDVKIKEKYGKINAIVLSRSAESDNVYIRDEQSIEQYGLCEIKIVDNQIMNFNDRADYLAELLDKLGGLEYFLNDYSSTGIVFLDYLDKYNINIDGITYNCLMLNDEINITQGLEELIYTEEPEVSETDYTKADKTDQRINQAYLIVDKQNQQIQSVISNVNEQNNKISQITQTVDELNSKISDIADITTSQESIYAKVEFQEINQSEPITIRVHPTGVHISYLYPSIGLFPANNLYLKDRKIRFTNLKEYIVTTNSKYYGYKKYYRYDEEELEYVLLVVGIDYDVGDEISGIVYENDYIDYKIPMDLLYYDEDNYDEFLLDYDSQTCQVRKKVQYNADGTTSLLENEATYTFNYPTINLDDGDYTVELLGYETAYIFVRLMAQNIYTTQFATKAELNSEINQSANAITANVNQTLTNYSTTTQMNSAISVKANEITSQVSETYETKDNANVNYSRLTQTATSLQSQINSNDTDISTLQQTASSLSSTVSQKVGNNEIISKINQSAEAVTILANKLGLTANDVLNLIAGNTINLTSKNIVIDSNNFKVTANGDLTCSNANVNGTIVSSNATITGGSITLNGNQGVRMIRVQKNNSNNTMTYITPEMIGLNNNGSTVELLVGSPALDLTMPGVSYTHVGYEGIVTPSVTQTSKESVKKDIKEYVENATDILKKSEIYEYNFKSEKDTEKKHIGFVIGDEGGDYKTPDEVISNNGEGIDTYAMTSILWKAVQEQQEIIEKMQNEIKELKGEKIDG